MKKLITSFLTLLSAGALYALPVGNPADPYLLCDGFFFEGSCCLNVCDQGSSRCRAFSFRAGYYGDFVFQRNMEVDRHEDHSFIENTEIFTNAGYLVLNFWDRIDLFGTLGATNLYIDTNISSFADFSDVTFFINAYGGRFDIETDTDFSWSVGARAILWECGCTTIGAEGQYFFAKPDIKRVTIGGRTINPFPDWQTPSFYPDDNISLKYQEWQFGLGISHRVNFVVPYAGIKWAHAKIDMDDALFVFSSGILPSGGINATLHDLKSRKDVGYALGVTLTDCQKMSATIEARFGDEKALYLNGQIRF